MSNKNVHIFGEAIETEYNQAKRILGGKGTNLAHMTTLGVPVPPGFTVKTTVCNQYLADGESLSSTVRDEMKAAIQAVEKKVGRTFGDPKDPLLVSVRSGAAISMPGMMDTILNLGMNRKCVEGLAELTKDKRFAWDTYRRFLQMFGNVVLEIPGEKFESVLHKAREESKVETDNLIPWEVLSHVATAYEEIIKKETGKPVATDPFEQLWASTESVFSSWNNARARTYRRLNGIPHDLGTAVNIQAMVYGNRGDTSGTGVLFSRHPSTGENHIFGEFLPNAQGEDVVAGIRTPHPFSEKYRTERSKGEALETWNPKIYQEIVKVTGLLEKDLGDMQDIEFTIEEGKLWILQTRAGKRTAQAAIRIAVDLVSDGLIDERKAVSKVGPEQLDHLLHPVFDPKAERKVLAKGLPASPGAASGIAVFTADEAERRANAGEKVVLIRAETSPEDIHGMHASEGILTSRGGMTSHAAVVARGMGKCCVVGCNDISVHAEEKYFVAKAGEKITEGMMVSIDGFSGEILNGELSKIKPELGKEFDQFMAWADAARTMKVRANADTGEDCEQARKLGAEGVGLCRTEHMFFDPERIDLVRQMILAKDAGERQPFIDKLYSYQLKDFRDIFHAMRGLPVTVRLLDPPLHEFLPRLGAEAEKFSQRTGLDMATLENRMEKLHEANPMLGHRGCRLGVTFPEIYEMQVRAIMTAAVEVASEVKETIMPEIMVPLISHTGELLFLRERLVNVAEKIKKDSGNKVEYLFGTMIEIPRAALVSDEIAQHVDFFSYGTNDLTQTTFGLSRDDAAGFLPQYIEMGILEENPFASIDAGVLQLVQTSAERGRKTKPKLKLGVCGEHGGDPASIQHFQKVGLNYVSCSTFRVPVARLAAAQAAIASA